MFKIVFDESLDLSCFHKRRLKAFLNHSAKGWMEGQVKFLILPFKKEVKVTLQGIHFLVEEAIPDNWFYRVWQKALKRGRNGISKVL